ncbi:MAG: hypothetical protein HYX55_03350 [Chloroflexi bacterium]|nr:hypothetical protein [Chloroflexota bacterium]
MRLKLRTFALAAAATLLIAVPSAVSATPVDDGCPTSGQLTAIADLLAIGDYGVPGRIDDPANGGNGDGYVCAFLLPEAVQTAWGSDVRIYMFNENTRTERKP